MICLLLLLSAIGHVILWATVVNRLHGLGVERRWVDASTAASGLAMAVIPLGLATLAWKAGGVPAWDGTPAIAASWCYIWLTALLCVVSAVDCFRLALHPERRGSLLANHTTRVDVRTPPLPPGRRSAAAGEGRGEGKLSLASVKSRGEGLTAPGIPTLLSRIPGNQVLDLHVHAKTLAIPRMPAGADELRIAHVTDFHMSGRIGKRYFERVADEVNQLQPDIVALTGDLVERNSCLDWLPETLGRLRAPHGVYFVLGNHDLRVDEPRMLGMLAELGLTHIGGKWQSLTIRGTPVVLAGNELPWHGTAPDLSGCPQRDARSLPLRILLAHAPDQFGWAERNDFDLILAGHNHGGQVRLPLLGAILAPSLSGTRYACGTFRRENTVLHVSRGAGSLMPVRWNCPPEIALLELCRAT